MTMTDRPASPRPPLMRVLARKNVLAGLFFIGVAAFGLYVSRNYPIGSALRMGTGYVPRLLLWVLVGLGGIILLQGLREADEERRPDAGGILRWWPIAVVTIAIVAFGLTIERLGLVVSLLLLLGIGSLADRELRPLETLIASVLLVLISWLIFIVGLGLTIPVWPQW